MAFACSRQGESNGEGQPKEETTMDSPRPYNKKSISGFRLLESNGEEGPVPEKKGSIFSTESNTFSTRGSMISRQDSKQSGSGPKKEKEQKRKSGLNRGLLVDAERMKENLHENLETKEYNVFDFYHETGFWQALAKNDKFSNVTLGVISINAVWIGVDSDHNTKPPGQTDLEFIIADQCFCVFFSFELLTRFLAFAKKKSCLQDGWFKFDSVLVALMVLETWVMPFVGGGGGGMGQASMLRLLRLLRLTRMARLLRSVPELVTLLKGMAAASRSVCSTLVLLIMFTYIFAIIFKQQTEEDEELQELFGTIPESMWTLLLAGTLLDEIWQTLNLLKEQNPTMCGLFLLWVLLSSFTILNMLIGVLCEVVSAVSESEREKTIVSFAKAKFLSVLERIDENNSGTINETEFEKFVMDGEVKPPLDDLHVDRENLMELSDVIFSKREKIADRQSEVAGSCNRFGAGRRTLKKSIVESEDRELKFGELLEMILDLRASNDAKVSHIVDLRKHLRANQKELTRFITDLDAEVEEVKKQLRKVDKDMRSDMERFFSRQELRIDQVLDTIVPLALGMQDLQKKFGCSNLVPTPTTARPDAPPMPRMSDSAQNLSSPTIVKGRKHLEFFSAETSNLSQGSSSTPERPKQKVAWSSPNNLTEESLRQIAKVDKLIAEGDECLGAASGDILTESDVKTGSPRAIRTSLPGMPQYR